MANIKTKRLWDEAWRKLSVFFSPSGSIESPFGALGIRITEPTTLKVETTGSDTTGDGSDNAPFRTIQGALEWLDGSNVQAKVTIQVGLGSFPGFTIEGSRLTIGAVSNPLVTVTSTGLEIAGTWSASTLASGTNSGTTTSAVVTDLALVITDSGQSWTTNDLQGRYVLIQGLYLPVISNTATTITLPVGAVLSGAYSVLEPGTVINSGTAGVGSLTGAQNCRIGVHNVTGSFSTSISISTLKVDLDGLAANSSGVVFRNSTGTFNHVSVVRSASAVSLNAFSINGSDQFVLNRCTTSFPGTAQGVAVNSVIPARFMNIIGSVFRNGVIGISPGNSSQFLQVALSTFDGCATGISAASGTTVSLAASGCRFVGCTTALAIGSSSFFGAGAALYASSSSTIYFANCGTILTSNNTSPCALGVTSGTGNTNGIVLTKGARCQIAATAVLGAVTELSVDGTTGTLATLRAASPKVFPVVPNAYGTYVYE